MIIEQQVSALLFFISLITDNLACEDIKESLTALMQLGTYIEQKFGTIPLASSLEEVLTPL